MFEALDSINAASTAVTNLAGIIGGMQQSEDNLQAQRETNWNNVLIAQMNNVANARLAAAQNKWNLEQWERENLYNSPAMQAQRLSGLGLSKSAIAQSVGNVPASPLQSAELANQQGVQLQAPQKNFDFSTLSQLNAIGIARQFEALRRERADADSATTEASFKPQLVLTDLDAQKAEVQLRLQAYQQSRDIFPHSLRAAEYGVRQREQDLKTSKLAYKIQQLNRKTLKTELSFLTKKREGEIQLLGEQVKRTIAETHKAYTSAANDTVEVGLKEEQKKSVSQETIAKELSNNLTRFGFSDSSPVTMKLAARLASGDLKPEQMEVMLHSINDYLIKAGKTLSNDDARWFLENVLNEGQGARNKQGIWTAGSVQELIDDFSSFLGGKSRQQYRNER